MSLFSGSTTIICGIQVFKACKHEFSFSKEASKETMAVKLFLEADSFTELNTNERGSLFLVMLNQNFLSFGSKAFSESFVQKD